MWSDTLKTREADYTQRALNALREVEWATPLLKLVDSAGGLVATAMPLLFEVRFAYELHLAGVTPDYEYATGENGSSVDFRIPDTRDWFVELVSLRASDAAKAAIRETGMIYKQEFSTTASNRSQTEEAEMITAEQKIGEKVFADGKPTKFPVPADSIHVIIADMRGYLDEGGDNFDYRQMACGASGIPAEFNWMVHYWQTGPDKLEAIAGLFEKSNPLRASKYIRERVHFLGFIREREYAEGEIRNNAYYLANPHLFASEAEARAAFNTFPLQPESGVT